MMKTSNTLFLRYVLVGLVAAIFLTADSTAMAQGSFDRIRRRNGTSSGEITSMNALGITISKGGVETTIPAEEIRSVNYAGEPTPMNSARAAAERGRLEEALAKFESIAAEGVDGEEVQQDLDYYLLLCRAKMALAGQGSRNKAIALAEGFMKKYSRSSFHVPAVIELWGDLLLAAGETEAAREKYSKLDKAPSPYFKTQSALLVGRAWQAEGKHREAIQQFERALNADVGEELGKGLKLEATLHKSISQSASGEAQQAAATVKQIISQADAEDARLLARAYNALGDCHLQNNDKQAALFAFLHVDLLYSSSGEDHAKALHELSDLWSELGHSGRAHETQQKLKEKYPQSRWASQ